MQCFYAAKHERGHLRGKIIMDFRLTNRLVSNHEYSNEDGQVMNSIQLADDVLTVVAVL